MDSQAAWPKLSEVPRSREGALRLPIGWARVVTQKPTKAAPRPTSTAMPCVGSKALSTASGETPGART